MFTFQPTITATKTNEQNILLAFKQTTFPPTATYKWLHNNNMIHNAVNPTLELKQPNQMHAGTYTCCVEMYFSVEVPPDKNMDSEEISEKEYDDDILFEAESGADIQVNKDPITTVEGHEKKPVEEVDSNPPSSETTVANDIETLHFLKPSHPIITVSGKKDGKKWVASIDRQSSKSTEVHHFTEGDDVEMFCNAIGEKVDFQWEINSMSYSPNTTKRIVHEDILKNYAGKWTCIIKSGSDPIKRCEVNLAIEPDKLNVWGKQLSEMPLGKFLRELHCSGLVIDIANMLDFKGTDIDKLRDGQLEIESPAFHFMSLLQERQIRNRDIYEAMKSCEFHKAMVTFSDIVTEGGMNDTFGSVDRTSLSKIAKSLRQEPWLCEAYAPWRDLAIALDLDSTYFDSIMATHNEKRRTATDVFLQLLINRAVTIGYLSAELFKGLKTIPFWRIIHAFNDSVRSLKTILTRQGARNEKAMKKQKLNTSVRETNCVDHNMIFTASTSLVDRDVESGSVLSTTFRKQKFNAVQQKRIQQRDANITLTISVNKKKFLLDLQASDEDTIPLFYGDDDSDEKRRLQERYRLTLECTIDDALETPVEVTFPGWYVEGRTKLVLNILARKLSGIEWTEAETSTTKEVLEKIGKYIQPSLTPNCYVHNTQVDKEESSDKSFESMIRFTEMCSDEEVVKILPEVTTTSAAVDITVGELLKVCSIVINIHFKGVT